MPTFITPYWQYGSNGDYAPDAFVGTSENDTFQLGGSEAGTSGGIRNGWDTFSGGFGTDRIYIAPKSGFSWTAAYIDTNGLDSVERIEFHDSLSVRPVYFQSSVNFSSVTYMSLNTKVYGSGFSDTFLGGSLGEYVEGDAGNDTLYGNGGNDNLYGDTTSNNPNPAQRNPIGHDNLYGGNGDDFLYGQWGNDRLWGEAGNDRLDGDVGADELRGGLGNDELFGGVSSDLLDGGAGINHIWGGVSTELDTFQFTSTTDQSVIEDYEIGEDLRFSLAIADDLSDLTFSDDANGNAHITVGSVDITFTGISSASISTSDIFFGTYS